MKRNYVTAIIAVVVGIAGFFIGSGSSGKNITAQDIQNMPQSQKMQLLQSLRGSGIGSFRGGTQNGGNVISGNVLSKDSQSITVKLKDGSSEIVFYSSSTAITKPVSGSSADIQTGSQIFVSGTQNSDGSITAQTIQLRPATNSSSN